MARTRGGRRRRPAAKASGTNIIIVAVCALLLMGIIALCNKISARQNSDETKGETTASHSAGRGAETTDDASGSSTTGNDRMAESDVAPLLDVKLPAGTPSQVMDYTGFRLSFNKDNRTPNWVAWSLEDHETSGAQKRGNLFWGDERVEGTPLPDDYKRSGYDRGHLCPAADQKWSQDAMHDCFVMTNMAPQARALNSGAWNTLEDMSRRWARRDGRLVIVAGPLYDKGDRERIGSGVRVPGAFYKAILAPDAKPARAIAFVYPNMSAPGNMQNYSMSIDELEALTGYDFFSALPDDIENAVESSASFREWNKR